MKLTGHFKAIPLSLYSADVYRDVAANWKGIGLLYLLLLLALCWLPSAARWSGGLRRFAMNEGAAIARQVPAVTIEKGIMRVDPPGRHVIRDPKNTNKDNETVFVIDDTIDNVPEELDGDEAIVLTRREFGMIRPSQGERRVWALTPSVDMEVDAADVENFFASLPRWLPVIGYVFCLAGSLLMRTLQSLAYGGIGMLLASQASATLDYPASIRLGAVAMTPVILLRTLLWFGPWEPSWYIRWPIAIAITVGYLRFAVRAATTGRGTSTPEVTHAV